MMAKGTQELESLLADLSAEKAKLAAFRKEIEEERNTLRQMGTEINQKAVELKAREHRFLVDTRDMVVSEAAALQRDIRQAATELRKLGTKAQVESAKTALANVQHKLKADRWQPQIQGIEVQDDSIKTGDTVLIKETNVRATVLSISQSTGQAEAQAGRARLTLSLGSLEKVLPTSGDSKSKFVPITKQVSSPVSMQLDLRGKRASEIEPALDSFLNNASASNLVEVRIIHGMATGTVRKIVREFLSSHPLVHSYRPGERGEGGDGATVVKL